MRHKPFLYFGTPAVSRDTLAALIRGGYRPEAVVTNPDAPRGRGHKIAPSETRTLAEANGIPVIAPERLTPEDTAALAAYDAAYAIVVAYGKILPEALLASFPLGALNVHYSLLPRYRGASPVEGALLAGERMTGVSIQKMVYELDAGDVLASREVAIGPCETSRELRPRLAAEGADLLLSVLPAFEDGTLRATPQDPARATFTRKIPKGAGELSLEGDAHENWNRYRAYAESPGTYFFMDRGGKRTRVKIITARLEDGKFIPERVVPEGRRETDFSSLA